MTNPGFEKFIKAVLLLTGSTLIGILGFTWIEDFTLIEAFYMTVITLSTVGFTEVRQLTDAGRLFTGFYIIVNLGIFAYVVSTIATHLFEGELNKIYKNLMIGRVVKRMKDHVIVCGFGRNGQKACEELALYGKKFVLVEMNDELISNSNEITKYQFIRGDATMDETLRHAGIERANCVITTLPKDADNVFITLTAKELNPKVQVIARASEEKSTKKLLRAGADRIVLPDALGGMHMAHLVTKPYVVEFLDVLSGVGDEQDHEKMVLEDFHVSDLDQDIQLKTLKQLEVETRTGAFVMAVKSGKSAFKFNPAPEIILKEDDVLIILGNKVSIEKFRQEYAS